MVNYYTFGAGGLIERRSPTLGNTYVYTFDPSGNLVQRHIIGSSLAADYTASYDAFGQQTGCLNSGAGFEPSNQDAIGWGGQWGGYTDQGTTAKTGANSAPLMRVPLVLCGFRYYDPSTGRFLSRDPQGMAGGVNLYAYTRNNPVNFYDPMGLNDGDSYWSRVGQFLVGEAKSAVNNFVSTAASTGPLGVFYGNRQIFATSSQDEAEGQTFESGLEFVASFFIPVGGEAKAASEATEVLVAKGKIAAEEFNIAAHAAQPRPRGALQSHHIIQDEWAKANIIGYSSGKAPSILLQRGNASHSIITTFQNARRDARIALGQGRWSSTLRQEFEHASRDLRNARVPDAIRKRAIKKSYKYFYGGR